jgi:hypothetical protein
MSDVCSIADGYSNDSYHESETREYARNYDYLSEPSTDNSYRNIKTGTKSAKYEDAGFNSVPCSFRGKGKNGRIEFYETSATPHRYIRDAISGVRRVPFRTGTRDEDLFFSVRMATGEGRYVDGSNLFYDSPEQYERHFRVVVPESIKQRWYAKVFVARERLNAKASEPARKKETETA